MAGKSHGVVRCTRTAPFFSAEDLSAWGEDTSLIRKYLIMGVLPFYCSFCPAVLTSASTQVY